MAWGLRCGWPLPLPAQPLPGLGTLLPLASATALSDRLGLDSFLCPKFDFYPPPAPHSPAATRGRFEAPGIGFWLLMLPPKLCWGLQASRSGQGGGGTPYLLSSSPLSQSAPSRDWLGCLGPRPLLTPTPPLQLNADQTHPPHPPR